MHRRNFLSALAASGLVFAQDEPTFKSDVKVVSILANVIDKQGHLIHDLTKEDFQVLENGEGQMRVIFEAAAPGMAALRTMLERLVPRAAA